MTQEAMNKRQPLGLQREICVLRDGALPPITEGTTLAAWAWVENGGDGAGGAGKVLGSAVAMRPAVGSLSHHQPNL
jgi:hypothetical protein